jgi:putative copper resistance protein D
MVWLGAEIDAPMVAVRAVHFAATATAAGALVFRAVTAPVLRGEGQVKPLIDARFRWLVWSGLATAFVSGILWLVLQTSSMSGQAVTFSEIATVINETQFGFVSVVRFALAIIFAACLVLDRWQWARWLALVSAVCFVAAIAWTGHAASTPFGLGYLHVSADALHLLGAAAWTGGLMALALVLHVLSGQRPTARPKLQLDVVRRFSCLGIVSVAMLLVSGIFNAWILVGSFRALVVTDYGWILMLKIGAFLIMVTLAAINRVWLTPRLAATESKSLHALARNTVAEIVLGVLIFAIVGLLGTLHPAAHMVQ